MKFWGGLVGLGAFGCLMMSRIGPRGRIEISDVALTLAVWAGVTMICMARVGRRP